MDVETDQFVGYVLRVVIGQELRDYLMSSYLYYLVSVLGHVDEGTGQLFFL